MNSTLSEAPFAPQTPREAQALLAGYIAGVKAARERPAYGRPPFGKRWEGAQLVDVDSEISIIVAIVEMRERGIRWADVVEALNAQGNNPRTGKVWTKRSAENIHAAWGRAQKDSAPERTRRTGAGPTPYGTTRRGGVLVVNKAEAEVIDWIAQMRRAAMSWEQLAEALNKKGILSRMGREWNWRMVRTAYGTGLGALSLL